MCYKRLQNLITDSSSDPDVLERKTRENKTQKLKRYSAVTSFFLSHNLNKHRSVVGSTATLLIWIHGFSPERPFLYNITIANKSVRTSARLGLKPLLFKN